MLDALVVLSLEASGLGEEEEAINVVMVSTTSGLKGEDVSISMLGLRVVGVIAVTLLSGTVVDVSDIDTARPLKV